MAVREMNAKLAPLGPWQSLTAWWDASPFTALTIEPLSTLSRERIVAKARLDNAEDLSANDVEWEVAA